MPYGVSKVPSVKYGLLHGVNRDRSGKDGILYNVSEDLPLTRSHVI
jgi:hypothetical protein